MGFVAGVVYTKDVDDRRESPALELRNLLLEKGAVVTSNDPHVPALPGTRPYLHLSMGSQPLTRRTGPAG